MKSLFASIILIAFTAKPIEAQDNSVNNRISAMMMRGDFQNVIDTSRQILIYDSLNPEIHFNLGLAYQNILKEDSSLSCFYNAARLSPENKVYNFMLAKGYYNTEKYKSAEPILRKLCTADSMNWVYAYYLTSIYMQAFKYDDAINIYEKFLKKDTSNCLYLNKIAWAYLKKEDFIHSIELYNKSLAIDTNNLTAIKNLSYLYSAQMNPDTAIQLLTRGIRIDSSDMDLHIRRAALYYSKHYTKRALDDYMEVLSSGDSSKLYLKRIGIGYCNNLQPAEAVNFLLKAYKKDSSDYETCSYLGQSYYKLEDMINSICYYKKVIRILTPASVQLGLTYILLGESQKGNGMYREAIDSYLDAMNLKPDPNIYMITANLYDEKLNDTEKAKYYYQKFLDNVKNSDTNFTPQYIETVKKRLGFLKTIPSGQTRTNEKI